MIDENVYTENSIRTVTGKVFDLKIMDPESICIEDIAHGLAYTPRFAGQLEGFYSVGQHSFYMAINASVKNRLAVLLHDATEAYMGDMPSPFKKLFPEFKSMENKLMAIIAKKFGFQFPFHPEVKELDKEFLDIEWNSFVTKEHPMPLEYEDPETVKRKFIELYNKILSDGIK